MVKRMFRAGFSILFLGLSIIVSARTAIAQMEKGDVNGDGVINVLDALQTVNFILETSPPPSDQEFWAADCNGDGQANILDVLGIINVILETGSCVSSCEGLDCDDWNSCTEDYCDSVLVQCVHDTMVPGSPCDDRDLCTENEVCVAGVCEGTPVDCDDDDPCTEDGCDPNAGCTHRELCCENGVDDDGDGDVDCDDGDCLVDDDDDGYYAAPCGGDCDDGDRLVNPEATEECHDGVDNDCDGYVDSEDCAVVTQSYCESVNDVDEGSMMFPKFDLNLGDLVGVDVSIVGTLRQDVMIENVTYRIPTDNFWLDTFFSLQFSIPGCPSDPLELEISTHLSELSFAEYDGVTDYEGESGVTFEDLLVCNTATCEVAEYGPYIGRGDVIVAFSGEFSRHENGYEGGQPFWSQEYSFDVQVCVKYMYERPLDADVPSSRFPTIQNALERVPYGGVIGIRPGRYDESLCIEGKLVHLVGKVGDGELAPEIVGTDMDAGVITVLSGGGLSAKNLNVSGGAYGIAGAPDDTTGEVLPAAVQLENVNIEKTSRGIYGNFSSLEGRDVEISNTEWNGMSILNAQLIHLLGFNIHDTGNIGILLFNVNEDAPGYLHVIGGKYIYGNSGGGIVVAGGAKPVLILGCFINANGDAGIDLIDTGDLVIQNTQVLNTYPRPDGRWGDGIRMWSSEIVTLMNSTISGNARAGISIFGCAPDHHSKLRFGDNILSSNSFDIEVGNFNTLGESCPPGSYELEHLGGTWCLDENGNPDECRVESSGGLEPPDPLDPDP